MSCFFSFDCPSIHLSVGHLLFILSIYLSIYLSICLSLCHLHFSSVWSSIHPSIHLFLCLSTFLSNYLSICLSGCLAFSFFRLTTFLLRYCTTADESERGRGERGGGANYESPGKVKREAVPQCVRNPRLARPPPDGPSLPHPLGPPALELETPGSRSAHSPGNRGTREWTQKGVRAACRPPRRTLHTTPGKASSLRAPLDLSSRTGDLYIHLFI